MVTKKSDVRAAAPGTFTVTHQSNTDTWAVVDFHGRIRDAYFPTKEEALKRAALMWRYSKLDNFVDPITDEILTVDASLPAMLDDANGTPIVGEDDEWGMWWGTVRAAWCLSFHCATVHVSGYMGAIPWSGVFIGTADEAVDYAERHGVLVDHVEDGDPGA
jgi:hypothetical protein